ncbi:unnamed protein product [Euphydryas editha]|uniref:Uncharacterized protein n=1 Tax=Euphydryas editha TaxID=104508 RepID=A0AAU9V1U1_EUPED|nr:unnamed protein product [Euphydryas editha]
MFCVSQTVGWYVTGGIVSGMRAERSRRAALAALAALFALGPCSAELEITTPIPFDPSKRGGGKYGDGCSTWVDCGFADSICDNLQKTCRCNPEFPVTNFLDKCGKRKLTFLTSIFRV